MKDHSSPREWVEIVPRMKRCPPQCSVEREFTFSGTGAPVPPGKISLDVNYDSLAPIGDPEEVEVTGAERATFVLVHAHPPLE